MSGRGRPASSFGALAATAPGRRIIAHAALRTAGYREHRRYAAEYARELPRLRERMAGMLLREIRADADPAAAQRAFAGEVGAPEMALDEDGAARARGRMSDPAALSDRVGRVLDSNFVRMTHPVLTALYDAAASHDGRDDPRLRRDVIDGHLIAIDLSEPMDRIADRDEDLEYLDDYRLMCPYMLRAARSLISRGGPEVSASFEAGFRDAMAGQRLDVELKSRPASATGAEMAESYKKYRSVMGTAGRNMALARRPLGEAFAAGMGAAAEAAGCGNEFEDSLRDGRPKVPSWPLYYSLLAGDARRGLELTAARAGMYLREARLALAALPGGLPNRGFLGLTFLSVEHYCLHWYGRLVREAPWARRGAGPPGAPA